MLSAGSSEKNLERGLGWGPSGFALRMTRIRESAD